MNVLAPLARISVEVVHDLVCPWCFLGARRLAAALRRRPDLACDLIWRPFLLNPDMPRGGITRSDYIARKFGGEERARRLYASISEIGQTEGVVFRFDRIRRTPSSVNSHRLVRWAERYGRSTAMVEALFCAYFTDGRDTGDIRVLAALAQKVGLDPHDALEFLKTDLEAEAVHSENLRAHRLGINGVPCFIIGHHHAIAGAQEPDVIERLLDVAAVEVSERQATGPAVGRT